MKKISAFIVVYLISTVFMLLFAGQAMADVQGIDVSRWQGTIDWDTAGEHAGFAIIKAGGSDAGIYTDSQFERNRDEARRIGIPRGYYYFAGGGDPIQEADHFAGLVGDLQPGEVLALDFEVDNPDPVAWSSIFLIRTEQLTGVKPLFYTNMNRVWKHDWKPVVDNGNPLWGAIYDGKAEVLPAPGSWPELTIKQYTNDAVIQGISTGGVDMNIFPGSIEDFQAMGLPKPVPPVVEKLKPEPVKPVAPEPVEPPKQDNAWKAEIQRAQVIEPERVVGVVPVEQKIEGATEILTIKWPARRPAFIETSYEMDFAAALDS
jgi:GH25 family lysozyme M1 (1,4-beta-N-acetylmuramidase)